MQIDVKLTAKQHPFYMTYPVFILLWIISGLSPPFSSLPAALHCRSPPQVKMMQGSISPLHVLSLWVWMSLFLTWSIAQFLPSSLPPPFPRSLFTAFLMWRGHTTVNQLRWLKGRPLHSQMLVLHIYVHSQGKRRLWWWECGKRRQSREILIVRHSVWAVFQKGLI